MAECDVLMKIQMFCDMTLDWITVSDVSEDLTASVFRLQIGLSCFTTYILKTEATYFSKSSVFICQLAWVLSHKTWIFNNMAYVRNRLHKYV